MARLVEWFRDTAGVYNIKELEKAFTTVAGVNSMQTKDYIQNLVDENHIRCERIGSGNWYWAFASDAKKSKDNVINNLKNEEQTLSTSIGETQAQLDQETALRRGEDEALEAQGTSRDKLLQHHEALTKEHEALDKELATYHDNDPEIYNRKVEEVKRFKSIAEQWTANIDNLETLLLRLANNDRDAVAGLMSRACGDEYIIGEGFRELNP
ncbi:hypothetical protein BP5796_10603 [Coleophoma crateriformis]|uniref:Meiotic nuclear division protein 1 n=1 Tax=Coleophoma crateriformis TaxID=565419 RepID=A0A3D8QQW2_9HELO|nr:hypothetical protein BP5796_10603 [Coleophoma crateriformis]